GRGQTVVGCKSRVQVSERRNPAAIAIIVICGGSSSIGRASDCGSNPTHSPFSHKNPVNMRCFSSLTGNCLPLLRGILVGLIFSFPEPSGRVRAERALRFRALLQVLS